jgi:hypothetical protein
LEKSDKPTHFSNAHKLFAVRVNKKGVKVGSARNFSGINSKAAVTCFIIRNCGYANDLHTDEVQNFMVYKNNKVVKPCDD